MTMPVDPATVRRIWDGTVEKVKVRLVLPGVWRAMEAAVPLTIEGETLVLGFSPSQSHQGGLLRDAKTNNIIERAVEEEAGRYLRVRIIEGASLEDWEITKRRDQEAVNLQKAAQERRQRDQSADQGWDGVIEQVTRKYAEMPMRQLPQMQALYLEESVNLLTAAVRRLLGDNPTELDHRSFARALDRIADRAQVPAALVAYLVHQKSGD
jgi:hypothetical protein